MMCFHHNFNAAVPPPFLHGARQSVAHNMFCRALSDGSSPRGRIAKQSPIAYIREQMFLRLTVVLVSYLGIIAKSHDLMM